MSFTVYKDDVIYDGGGGGGAHTLSFQALQDSQHAMFSRTIQQGYSAFQRASLEQEKRQLVVQEALKHITVNVYREDFPDIYAKIPIAFYPSAAQEVWGDFLANICKALKIEFIHSILERGDKAPVNRILRLKDQFDYLVKQRESSAVLEIINSQQPPLEISWEITKDIIDVKRDLQFNLKHQDAINARIHHLVHQKMTTKEEKEFSERILKMPRADMLVKLICSLYIDENQTKKLTKEDGVRALNINYADIKKYEGKVDVVVLHRLAIERLNRIFLVHENPALVVKQSIHYIVKLLADLKDEVEIVTLGLKYISEIIVHTIPFREYVFHCILDAMQHYVGPPAKHRPRHPKRLQNKANAEYKFDETLTNHVDIQMKQQQEARSGNVFDPTTLDPTLDIHKFTRYGDYETLIYDRSANRQVSNIIEQFAREYEIDDQLRPITPRTKAKRIEEKRKIQEAEKRRKEELLKPPEPLESPWKSVSADVGVNNGGRPGPSRSRPASGRRTPPTSSPKMIIRSRERMDAGSAKQALEEAMQAPAPPRNRSPLLSSKSNSHLQSPSSGNHKTISASAPLTKDNKPSEVPSSSSRPSSSQREEKLPSISKPKAPKFRIRNGKDETNGTEATGTEASNDGKKRWKGTRGDIGKAPPDRKAEDEKLQAAAVAKIKQMQEDAGLVSIDDINQDGIEREERASFLPPISSRPNTASRPTSGDATHSGIHPSNDQAPSKPVENGVAEEKAPQLADATTAVPSTSQGESVPVGLPGDESPDKSPKKKKKKVIIKPLPVVDCPKFRPYEAQMREAIVLVQAFASLLRLLSDNYGHREWAFKQHIMEEVAEIVLVCPSIPKVLDYFIDIIETMYAEGYRDIIDNMAQQLIDIQLQDDRTVDNTMVLSNATPRSSLLQGSMTLEAMSDMSVPAFDPDTRFDTIKDMREALPSDNNNSAAFVIQEIKDEGSVRSINAIQDKPEPGGVGMRQLVVAPHHVASAPANFGDKGRPVPGRKKPLTRNLELMKQIGQAEFELRYVRTPADSIIIAISMCAAHVECGRHEREIAEYWLEVWNDNSRDYKNLVRKGKNVCAL